MLASAFLIGAAPPHPPETSVTVHFEVILPEGTPEGPVYVAGNLPVVGEWKADGFRLERTGSRTAFGSFEISPVASLEYKFTRGAWANVEKGADFSEISNRRLRVVDLAEYSRGPVTVKHEIAAWGDSAPPRRHTLSGDIRFHRDFPSAHLGNRRTITVYLPPGYDSSRSRYPVLYMHDGQNIFDAATSFIGVEWGVDEACEKLIRSRRITPVIVVGIDNNESRVDEYTTAPSTHAERAGGGRGELYSRFVVEEVKPFIDAAYRTLPDRRHTAVMGSSLGGIISLHMAWTRPQVFGAAGVISPALWWSDSQPIKTVQRGPAPNPKPNLWIDMGTAEGDNHVLFNEGIRDLRELAKALRRHGFRSGRNLKVVEAQGADHSERAWNARIEDILIHFYGR